MPKHELTFNPPLLNAAGSLGFTPDPHGPLDLANFGAFITNPVSSGPRQPASPPRLIGFPGGVLLHTGHPNPGIKAVLKRYRGRWARASLPVVVHLLADDPARVARAVHRLEETEGVAGVELGLRAGIDIGAARELVQAATGELPVLARVGLDSAQELGLPLMDAGANIVVLGPPRGTLPDKEGNLVSGRVYGPALLALALEAVRCLASQGVSVQAGCGAYRAEDIAAFYSAGAAAVQLDTVLWRGKWDLERLR